MCIIIICNIELINNMFILTRVVRIQILNKMMIFKYTNEKNPLIIHRCRIIHITKDKNDIQCAEMTKYWFRSDANSTKHGKENGDSIFIRLYCHFINDNWFAMQGPVAIILISWNVILIWETGLFDLLKSLFDLLKVYIPIPRSCRNIFRLCRKDYKRWIFI